MKKRKLGMTDLEVSEICLGTMTWGQQNTESEGHQQMDYALDKGINFFDTAEMYAVPPKKETQGSTERIIGSWFKESTSRELFVEFHYLTLQKSPSPLSDRMIVVYV